MTARPDDAVSAYLAVLRGVGLGELEIRRLHGVGGSGDEPLDRIITRGVDASTDEQWHEQLAATIYQSQQGLELPRFYKSRDAADAIAGMAAAHGYEAAVEPREGREFAIELTDELTGETDRCLIGYPDTELGADNLPALLAAIERIRFADDGLTVALLSTTEHWQAVLVEQSALDGLREQFGDRIEPFGEPLLTEYTPLDFVADPPVPGLDRERELEDPSAVDLETWLENATVESTERVIEALEESGTKTVVAENKSNEVLETIEQRAESTPVRQLTAETSTRSQTDGPETAGEDASSTADGSPASSGGSPSQADPVVRSDQTADEETGADDREHDDGARSIEDGSTTTSTASADEDTNDELTAVGGGPKKTVSTAGIDEVFEKLEEKAPEPDELGGPIERVESDSPAFESGTPEDPASDDEFGSLSGGGPTKRVSDTSADDILANVEDAGFDSFQDGDSDAHVETDPDAVLDEETTGQESTLDDETTTETEMLDDIATDDEADRATELEPAADEMEGFVGDELSGDGTTRTRSELDWDGEDEQASSGGSLDEIEGLADRVAERLSEHRPDDDDSQSPTEATDGGRKTSPVEAASNAGETTPNAPVTPDDDPNDAARDSGSGRTGTDAANERAMEEETVPAFAETDDPFEVAESEETTDEHADERRDSVEDGKAESDRTTDHGDDMEQFQFPGRSTDDETQADDDGFSLPEDGFEVRRGEEVVDLPDHEESIDSGTKATAEGNPSNPDPDESDERESPEQTLGGSVVDRLRSMVYPF